MTTKLTTLLGAVFVWTFTIPSFAQETIPVGPQALMGVPIGTEAETAVSELKRVFGEGDDSGWIEGCEFNGVKERYVKWGSLTVAFEETENFGNVLINWSFALDRETSMAKPGGPRSEQIVLPRGVHVGDRFSDVAKLYGFEPFLDDVFGIGIYKDRFFEIMTASDDLNGPIAEVAVPHFSYCE